MSFKKDAAGALRWDKSTAGERWGKNANRPDFVEAAELMIDRGAVAHIWDTLADPNYRPADLQNDEELYVMRKALRKAAEMGKLDENLVAVLLRLLDGADRLRAENKLNHAAVREHLRKYPAASLGRLAQKFGISRDTARRIKEQAPYDD
jgi:hypothetical protein